jgi:hypothetical protein
LLRVRFDTANVWSEVTGKNGGSAHQISHGPVLCAEKLCQAYDLERSRAVGPGDLIPCDSAEAS